MTLRDKLRWDSAIANRLATVEDTKSIIASGQASKARYYWFVGETHGYAVECYLEGEPQKSKEAAQLVVHAALEYFYGDWRKRLPAPDGQIKPAYWRKESLWYDEINRSLPWACALGDWNAVRKIAEYPLDDSFPQSSKVYGGSAIVRGLICYLRGEPRKNVEWYLAKAITPKAKRPGLLAPILQALLDDDAVKFSKALPVYLAYYRKSEFKRELDKVLALDGTTLYHLGRKQGFKVQLPEEVADHIIRFD